MGAVYSGISKIDNVWIVCMYLQSKLTAAAVVLK